MHYITFAPEELLITKSADCRVSLSLNYQSHTISEVSRPVVQKSIGFYSLIGLKHINNYIFLLVSDAVEEITCIGLSKIYQIKSTRWIAMAPLNEQQIRIKQHQEELQNLSTIFQNGNHYYSETYDLSAPFLLNKHNSIQNSTRQYYDQFIWNDNLATMDGQQDQQQVTLFQSWCCRIIQGSVQEYAGPFCNRSIIRYLLISRKSHKKAGTRFYARGIDDDELADSYVGRFNIYTYTDKRQVFISLFSVPAFFSQVGINGLSGETIIQRTQQLTRCAFERHFKKLQQIYGRIVAINLLSLKKEEEKSLTLFFEGLITAYGKEKSTVKYRFFDFHQQCKSDNFSKTQNLMDQVQQQIESLMFNCYKISEERFLCQQAGVFRTNCLDCLDRTNYVQSRLALRNLRLFLTRFGDTQTLNLISARKLLDFPVNEEFPILKGFNSLWADNGQILSLLYTGIGSTHTDITRTGQRNFLGTVNHKFKSLRRFYAQFNDHQKHKAITKLVSPSSPRLNLSVHNTFQTALLFSFVISDNQEQVLATIKKRTERGNSKLIVCYVYQAFEGDLWNKFKQLFSASKEQLSKWQAAITNNIGYKYVKIVSLIDNHSWIGIFCLKQATDQLSHIKSEILTSQIGCGEVLLVKMKLQDSSFVFAGINCPNFDNFLTVLDQIHQKGFQISKLGLFESASFLQLDYRVVLGNTGSKVLLKTSQFPDLQSQLAKKDAKRDRYLSSRALSKILDHDQLSMEQSRSQTKFLREYSEGSLEFIPAQNRMLFWNQQAVVLKIRDYCKIGEGSIGATLDYQISKELVRE